jgi:hypothetical protein
MERKMQDRREKIKQLMAVIFTKYNKDLSTISDITVDIWTNCLSNVSDRGLEVAMRHRFGTFMPSIDQVEIVGLRLDNHMLSERIKRALDLYQHGKLETLKNKYFYRAFLRNYTMIQNEKNNDVRCEKMRQTIFTLMEHGCAEIPAALITQEAGEPISKEKAAENLRKLKEALPHVFGSIS